MNIVYCRSCANELPDTAPICTNCGAPQARVARAAGLINSVPLPPPPRAIGKWIRALVLTGLLSTLLLLVYPMLVGLGWFA